MWKFNIFIISLPTGHAEKLKEVFEKFRNRLSIMCDISEKSVLTVS